MSIGRGETSNMVIEDNSDLKTDTRLARNSTASTFARVAMARQNMSFCEDHVTPKGFRSKYWLLLKFNRIEIGKPMLPSPELSQRYFSARNTKEKIRSVLGVR